MRSLVSLVLIGLIIACPVLCGASEAYQYAHRHDSAQECPNESSPPVHCPQDGDDCICNGAVRAGDVKPTDLNFVGALLFIPVLSPTPPHPLPHLTQDGAPTGLAAWGDSLTVRALLQNFRW